MKLKAETSIAYPSRSYSPGEEFDSSDIGEDEARNLLNAGFVVAVRDAAKAETPEGKTTKKRSAKADK